MSAYHVTAVRVTTMACIAIGCAQTAALGQTAALAQSTIMRALAFDTAELLAPPKTGWITNGGNLYNQRYSLLTQIDRRNVGALKAAWRTHLRGSGVGPQYSGVAQSIVYAGTLYIITGANTVTDALFE